jgi:subtilisin-like proprotein convertase family protein
MKRTAAWTVRLVVLLLAVGAVLAADSQVLIKVERRATNDLTALRTAGLPVVKEMETCLFLRGDAKTVAHLQEQGYRARAVDTEDASKWDYWVVGVRPDSDMRTVEAQGTVLDSAENWYLVRVPLGTSSESVYDAKVFVSRIGTRLLDLPKEQPSLAPSGDAATLLPLPLVQQLVANVSTAQIDQFWTDVTVNSPYGTRYSTGTGAAAAVTYVYNKFLSYKLGAAYQNWSTTHANNVIGTSTGAVNPANVYIVIGHIDDLPSSGTAPGADDNASGSVNVLEAARAMSCFAYKNTIKFITVTGEEAGLLGSTAYANDAASRGENILGVINMDMPGWAGDGSPSPENLDMDCDANSMDLGSRYAAASTTYSTGLAVDSFLCPSLDASDHYPFWTHGWKAVCGITDNEGYCSHAGNYPYYHTSNDTIANCGNKTFYYAVVRTTVATLGELAEPFKIMLDRSMYACNGSTLTITLGDRDLNTNASVAETVTINISSNTESAPEQVVLTEQGTDSMIFKGTIATASSTPVHGDGVLSVAAGDTITATYTDALDCNGSTNVVYNATAPVDCTAPTIASVYATSITGSTANIVWTTNEASNSVVHYGTTPPGSLTASSATLVASHSVGLTGLVECTQYYYWVESTDAAGNTAVNNNGGAYYTFTTGKNSSPTYTNSTAVLIPDNSTTGATSSIVVTDTNNIVDLNVRVNITHTYDSELTLNLIGPSGASIILSNKRGSSGDNYTSTVFDDQATTAISAGAAPFTGSFIPDTALSTFNGLAANGTWSLKVVDSGSGDTGSILNWSLLFTYAAGTCGPGANYSSNTKTDSCAAGGAHSGDGTVDRVEDVVMPVTIRNVGTVALTGVTATLVTTTSGVTVTRPTATYPDIALSATASSVAPHFAFAVGPTVAMRDRHRVHAADPHEPGQLHDGPVHGAGRRAGHRLGHVPVEQRAGVDPRQHHGEQHGHGDRHDRGQ